MADPAVSQRVSMSVSSAAEATLEHNKSREISRRVIMIWFPQTNFITITEIIIAVRQFFST
jgi:hypothetical protein